VLGYADEEVDATAADPRIAELLGVPRRDPLLRIRQLIYRRREKRSCTYWGFTRFGPAQSRHPSVPVESMISRFPPYPCFS